MKKRLKYVLASLLTVSLTACGTVTYDDSLTENESEITSPAEDSFDSHSVSEEKSEVISLTDDNFDSHSVSDHEIISAEFDIDLTEETREETQEKEIADTFGILVSLPENTSWIIDREYHLTDENNLEITYYDSVAEADCTVLVSKNENLVLPEIEYDETLNESWEGWTVANQNIVVKVQHGKNDSKVVLATWEYKEYQFAIIGEVKEISDSIPKAALNIINNLT